MKLVVRVSDHGSGLTLAAQARIFERLQRGVGPQRNGLGLG